MIKIAHCADIHIRGLQYLDEMEYTFERFYESLEIEKPDYIVICGDLYHSKLTVTNEYFVACRRFISRLAQIASVIIIPGNHDLALNNLSRVDAITPVMESINLAPFGLRYSKHSECINGKEDNLKFWHFSCLDSSEKWPNQNLLNKENINIALYHGSINGSRVDNDWVSRGNKDDITLFDGFDFALLGDIHKQQYLSPKIAYPGSLRQNNYGEDLQKGYLIWEIDDKDNFTSRFIELPQKRYFITIHTDSHEHTPIDLGIPEDCRIRVVLTKPVTLKEEFKIKELVEKTYKPRNDVPILCEGELEELSKFSLGSISNIDNIRNIETQKILLKEYYKNTETVTDDVLSELIQLDQIYHSGVNTDVLRNIQWLLRNLEWSNLFSYGEGNRINFEKTSGLIGIFGENGIGKSSAIDALLYAIQNTINKEGAVRNVDYINDKKLIAKAKVDIFLNSKHYRINRETEKKVTKKGEEKANNTISFKEIIDKKTEKSLEGETIPDTNKIIRDYFGTIEDFNMISVVSQGGLTNFIDSRGTKRKEITTKFLDLGIFEEKFKPANEDAKKIKEKLLPHDGKNYLELMESAKAELREANRNLRATKKELKTKKKELETTIENIFGLRGKLTDKVTDENILDNLWIEKSKIQDEISAFRAKQAPIAEELSHLKIDADKQELYKEIGALQKHETKRHYHEKEKNELKKRVSLIHNIPNVEACAACLLAKDAYESKVKLAEKEQIIYEDLSKTRKEKEETLAKLQRYEDLLMSLESYDKYIFSGMAELTRINHEIIKYTDLKNEIENNKNIKKQLNVIEKQRKSIEAEIKELETQYNSYNRTIGSLEEKLSKLQELSKEAYELRHKYYIYQLYLDAMGKDGIAYMIMSQKLPIIEKEINHILSQVTNSRVVIQDDLEERSLKMYLQDFKGTRIIELASGAEKTMVSLALRAALWNISSLPKCPLLILDEPFGYLDNTKYDSVLNLLSYLKNYFKHIIVISHNEDIKAAMDQVVYVEKDEEGLAHLEV